MILAKWLARKVGVLLLDEPTQGVDVAAKAQIHALIRDFARRGGGVLVSSSDLAELTRVCDSICALHQGQITARLDRADGLRRKAAARRHRRMTMGKRFNLVGQIPLITLVVLCVVTALLTNRFLSPLNLTNILVQSSIMAVIAIGMTFVIIGGGFDLSVGSTVALAGCIAAMTMVKFGIAAGVLAGIAAGAAVGLANGLIIAKLGVNPFITTLGTMVLVRGLVYLITGGAPVGDDGMPSAFIAFGSERLLGIHYLVWVPAILLAVLSFVMHMTPYGRRIYATGGNREAAYLSGVPVERIIASTYVWCGGARGRGRRHARRAAAIRPAHRRRILRADRHRRRGAGRRLAAWRRRHALQEHHRRLHHDRAGQQPQSAQRRFLLAAGRDRRGHHCRRGGGSATLAVMNTGGSAMLKLRHALLAAALLLPAALVPAPASAQQKITIGVSLAQDDNPFYIAMLRGIRARAQELGWEVATVSANEDKVKQINGVQDLVARGVKGVLISPIDAVGVNAAYDAAKAGNVPIVSVARGSTSPNQTLHVAMDEKQIGRDIAEWTAKTDRRRRQGGDAARPERRADVPQSRRRLHRGDGEASENPDRVEAATAR